MAQELTALEARLVPEATDPDTPVKPDGLSTLLYVGGRPGDIHRLRRFAAGLGLMLLDHDGGVEDRAGLLPGLVSRADAVCFPVDCVSHDAALAVKRLCRQAAKPCLPLRSTGLGAFMAGLARLGTPSPLAGEGRGEGGSAPP
jgi:hypothetical protein